MRDVTQWREVGASEKRVSRKAQQLIDKHEVDLAVFEGLQIVREADVLRYLESGSQMPADETDEIASSAPTGSTVALPPEILEGVLKAEAAVGPAAPSRPLSLWEEARAAARDRGVLPLRLLRPAERGPAVPGAGTRVPLRPLCRPELLRGSAEPGGCPRRTT